MNDLKKLELQGCRTFVCPNLTLIDEKCKEYNLKIEIIERAKKLAIEYFSKTYHRPHFASARHVIPSIVQIASILEQDKIPQKHIAMMFDTTTLTVRKWYNDIIDVLGINIIDETKNSLIEVYRDDNIIITDKFLEIDKLGKSLLLKERTIDQAKDLASKYFDIVDIYHYHPYLKQLWPAFIYMASILENDYRRQLDVASVSGITECYISKWFIDIQKRIDIKIIRCGKTHRVYKISNICKI